MKGKRMLSFYTDLELRVRELGRKSTREEGAGMVEYALLVALIGVLLIAVLVFLRGGIENTFSEAANELN
jgi:Flp pilus assembly pilin Flp